MFHFSFYLEGRDAESNSDTDTDTDANTNADTDANAGANTNAEGTYILLHTVSPSCRGCPKNLFDVRFNV